MTNDHMGTRYRHFVAVMAISTVVMFGLLHLNVDALGHVEFSQGRF